MLANYRISCIYVCAGVITLNNEHQVCKKGEKLSPEKGRILVSYLISSEWSYSVNIKGKVLSLRMGGWGGEGGRSHCRFGDIFCVCVWSPFHGWEIAVILRNFRKTKLSKSKFLFFSFFQQTYNVQLDDFRFATYANIAFRHFTALLTAKPPSSVEHAWYRHGVPSAQWTPARYFYVFQ